MTSQTSLLIVQYLRFKIPFNLIYYVGQKSLNLKNLSRLKKKLCVNENLTLQCLLFRYWAVTQAHYIRSRNARNITGMICLVWIMSVVVSLAPLLGWKDQNWLERVQEGECMVSFSTKLGTSKFWRIFWPQF